jgi:hypothetical protein
VQAQTAEINGQKKKYERDRYQDDDEDWDNEQ